MADPITWGLINLVKKGVKGVQTTLDGVSDKVSGLPDSLDVDFAEVKNAIAGVKTDVGGVNTAVSGVKSDTSSIKNTVDTNPLLASGSAVKSIQRGAINSSGINLPAGTADSVYNINISTINANKSILIYRFFVRAIGSGQMNDTLKSVNLTNNQIKITLNGFNNYSWNNTSVYGEWQVIEFY